MVLKLTRSFGRPCLITSRTKGIHNLIWAWTTQNYNGDANTYNNDADWYPGDEYVDIIGRDLYGYDATKQAQEFKEI